MLNRSVATRHGRESFVALAGRRWVCAVLAVVAGSAGRAMAVNWTGADATNPNDWTDPLNWSPNTVPTSSIDATINLPGVLIVTPGQTVRALSIGDAAASNGSLTVGAGNMTIGSLTASGATTVGNLGNGSLTISGGAAFTSVGLNAGAGAGSNGTVTVTGTGSNWTASGAVNIGNASGATGDLEILSGGVVNLSGYNFTTIGAVAGSTGLANISGAGSSLTAFLAAVGGGGNGTLALSNGGHLAATAELAVGYLSTGTMTMHSNATATVAGMVDGQLGTGLATISDSGTKLTSTGSITLGAYTAGGTMNVVNGGAVETATLTVGGSSAGALVITGAGSSLTVDSTTANSFVLGQTTGGGNVSVLAGGKLTTVNAIAGFVQSNGAGSGNITVSGTGSTWANSGNMDIAQEATTASLSVLAGGKVTTNEFQSDGNGNVTVDGAGSSLTSAEQYTVGTLANATQSLRVSGGGAVAAELFQFGLVAGSSSNVTVTGANSTLTSSNYVYLGQSGAANMTVSDGAMVTTKMASGASVIVAVEAGSSGNLTLTDAGTKWTAAGQVAVGSNGTATMLIENGAVMTSAFGLVGDGGTGNVTITGAGSLWDTSGVAGNVSEVGRNAVGTVTISAGGEFRVSALYVAGVSGVFGSSVMVTGTGSKLTAVQDIDLGVGSMGTLTVAAGGAATSSGLDGFVLGTSMGATGVLNVGNGGVSGSVSAVQISGGFVNVNPIGGTGNGTLNFNHTDDIVFSVPLKGALTVNQMAAGNTTLTGNSTYSGNTTISAGVLQIGNGGTSGSLGTGPVADGTSLVFNRSNVLSVANAISGLGNVSQVGAGTTLVTGANTYAGGTTIGAGKVFVENVSGSALGSGPVITHGTIGGGAGAANGGTISTEIPGTYTAGAIGVVNAAVTVEGDGTLAPGGTSTGGSSVGTLTVSSLGLLAGATLNYDFAATTNDFTAVTSLAGLSFLTAGVNLYQEGTTTPFGTPGTYHLIGYNGVPLGVPTGLTVLDPVAGDLYLFTLNPVLSTVDLTIVGTPTPEPGSLAMLLIGAGLLVKRRSRSR